MPREMQDIALKLPGNPRSKISMIDHSVAPYEVSVELQIATYTTQSGNGHRWISWSVHTYPENNHRGNMGAWKRD